jgi:hypothetical protein
VIKNKMRQSKGKIGYLPVDQILEGPPLECTDQCPQNAGTEAMHQRMQLIASRLDKRQTEAIEHFPSAIILPSADGLMGIFIWNYYLLRAVFLHLIWCFFACNFAKNGFFISKKYKYHLKAKKKLLKSI